MQQKLSNCQQVKTKTSKKKRRSNDLQQAITVSGYQVVTDTKHQRMNELSPNISKNPWLFFMNDLAWKKIVKKIIWASLTVSAAADSINESLSKIYDEQETEEKDL